MEWRGLVPRPAPPLAGARQDSNRNRSFALGLDVRFHREQLRRLDEDLLGLLRRIAAREERALAELYDKASPLVFGLAQRILGDAAAAEDATLDVFMHVWRRASDFDPQRGTPTPWLVMLARSRALDRRRSCARQRIEQPIDDALEREDDARPPAERTVLLELHDRVQRALLQVSPPEREAIRFAFFQGLSHSEIAERLHQPLGTVKTRIRSGLMKLRRLLEPLGAT